MHTRILKTITNFLLYFLKKLNFRNCKREDCKFNCKNKNKCVLKYIFWSKKTNDFISRGVYIFHFWFWFEDNLLVIIHNNIIIYMDMTCRWFFLIIEQNLHTLTFIFRGRCFLLSYRLNLKRTRGIYCRVIIFVIFPSSSIILSKI